MSFKMPLPWLTGFPLPPPFLWCAQEREQIILPIHLFCGEEQYKELELDILCVLFNFPLKLRTKNKSGSKCDRMKIWS